MQLSSSAHHPCKEPGDGAAAPGLWRSPESRLSGILEENNQSRGLMIACYLRVSSQSRTTVAQKADVERWLVGQGHDPEAVRWFTDKETGATLDRPAFEDLKAAIFHGEVKTVVVWKLDRLSRNQRDGINLLADWCEQGVRIVSVTQQLDSRSQ